MVHDNIEINLKKKKKTNTSKIHLVWSGVLIELKAIATCVLLKKYKHVKISKIINCFF